MKPTMIHAEPPQQTKRKTAKSKQTKTKPPPHIPVQSVIQTPHTSQPPQDIGFSARLVRKRKEQYLNELEKSNPARDPARQHYFNERKEQPYTQEDIYKHPAASTSPCSTTADSSA
eukprot:UN02879